KVFPYANLSMIYSHDPYGNYTSISYRSMDNRTDSTEIAKLSEGGGHRNASGGRIQYLVNNPPGLLIDDYRAYHLLKSVYTKCINKKNFLFLNSPVMQKYFCTYLMQERFFGDENKEKNKNRIDKNLPGYQEGLFCMRLNKD